MHSYPSKILLFGEYAILHGGSGLAIPYPAFHAEVLFNQKERGPFISYLEDYLHYLQQNGFEKHLDLSRFAQDMEEGLDITSNIPIGYGVGSSGVITAAIYDLYKKNTMDESDLHALQLFLASMEDHFHQKSSGLDPLVCYLHKPLLLHKHAVQITDSDTDYFPFHLYDTGKMRHTQEFVSIFHEKMRDLNYTSAIMERFHSLTEICISSLLKKNRETFYSALKELSAFQLEYFTFAIPESVQSIWKEKWDAGTSYFKLCGAGGGGFMLEFTI
ncbi:MAG: hypothetical protein R2794_10600 [Chitinophagales bacterium]